MKIDLASNLKELRKRRGMTQEDLAGFLGVSFQAVSKWERGDGYPDLTLLPALADFFGVTVDALLGTDSARRGEQLAEVNGQWAQNNAHGRHAENIALMRDALKAYPDEYLLMAQLVTSLEKCDAPPDERAKNKAEAIEISERIVRFCDDPTIKNAFLFNLCDSYGKSGEMEKAAECARRLPILYKTQENALVTLLEGTEKIDVGQRAVLALLSSLFHQVMHMTNAEHYSADEKIAALRSCIDAADILLERGGSPTILRHKSAAWVKIAGLLLGQGRRAEALDSLTCAVDAAERSMSPPEARSLLINRTAEKAATPDDVRKLRLAEALTAPLYEPLRGDERFVALCERISKIAK